MPFLSFIQTAVSQDAPPAGTGLRESLRLLDMPAAWVLVLVVLPIVLLVCWLGYRGERRGRGFRSLPLLLIENAGTLEQEVRDAQVQQAVIEFACTLLELEREPGAHQVHAIEDLHGLGGEGFPQRALLDLAYAQQDPPDELLRNALGQGLVQHPLLERAFRNQDLADAIPAWRIAPSDIGDRAVLQL